MESKCRSIKIYGRVKPFDNSKGVDPVEYDIYDRLDVDGRVDGLKNKIILNHKPTGEVINNRIEQQSFQFCKVFDQDTEQLEVYDVVAKPVVDSVLQGYNGTVFAYGQTGSGKTFSITGGPDKYEDRGIIPRSIQHIFGATQKERKDDSVVTVFISYCEIYNETGYDLLDAAPKARKRLEDLPRVTISEDLRGNFHFRNLSVKKVHSEEEALNLLFLGDSNRVTAETSVNKNSTRSHCVFTIVIAARSEGSGKVRRSKMNLVDLAGSERVSKTGVNGKILEEAKNINLSLHYLEQVIVALSTPDCKHIPYRNSMMTIILKDSLGGNCLTTMLATLSAEQENILETISTCRFAQRVALIKNEVFVNEELDPQIEIKILKEDIKALKNQLTLLGVQRTDEELTEDEQNECRDLVQEILTKDSLMSLPQLPNDLRKIRQCAWLLKCAVADAEQTGSREVAGELISLLQERDQEIASLRDTICILSDEDSPSTSIVGTGGGPFPNKNFPRIGNKSNLNENQGPRLSADRDSSIKGDATDKKLASLRSILEQSRNDQLSDSSMDDFLENFVHQIHEEEKTYRQFLGEQNELKETTANKLMERIELNKLKMLFEFRNLYQEKISPTVRSIDTRSANVCLEDNASRSRSSASTSTRRSATPSFRKNRLSTDTNDWPSKYACLTSKHFAASIPNKRSIAPTVANYVIAEDEASAAQLDVFDSEFQNQPLDKSSVHRDEAGAPQNSSTVSSTSRKSFVPTTDKSQLSTNAKDSSAYVILESDSLSPMEGAFPKKNSFVVTSSKKFVVPTYNASVVSTKSNMPLDDGSVNPGDANSVRQSSGVTAAATSRSIATTSVGRILSTNTVNTKTEGSVHPVEAGSVVSTAMRRSVTSPNGASQLSTKGTDISLHLISDSEAVNPAEVSSSRKGSVISSATRRSVTPPNEISRISTKANDISRDTMSDSEAVNPAEVNSRMKGSRVSTATRRSVGQPIETSRTSAKGNAMDAEIDPKDASVQADESGSTRNDPGLGTPSVRSDLTPIDTSRGAETKNSTVSARASRKTSTTPNVGVSAKNVLASSNPSGRSVAQPNKSAATAPTTECTNDTSHETTNKSKVSVGKGTKNPIEPSSGEAACVETCTSQRIPSSNGSMGSPKMCSLQTLFWGVENESLASGGKIQTPGGKDECLPDTSLDLGATVAEFEEYYNISTGPCSKNVTINEEGCTPSITCDFEESGKDDSGTCQDVMPCPAVYGMESKFNGNSCALLESDINSVVEVACEHCPEGIIGVTESDANNTEILVPMNDLCLTGDPEIDEEILAFYKSR